MDVNIGKGITLAVDANALPPNALEHVIYIGLRNILMDSHAGIDKDEDDYQAKSQATAEKKLAALMSGEVRVSSGREGDPIKSEAVRLATLAVKAAIRKAGKKLSDYDAKVIREKALSVMDKFMEQAQLNVASAKALSVDVEL